MAGKIQSTVAECFEHKIGGGSSSDYQLLLESISNLFQDTEKEKSLVKRILSLVESDYIGIDFLFDGGHLIFNEIEDTVGARMVYDKTDIDIIKLYCDYIKKNIQYKNIKKEPSQRKTLLIYYLRYQPSSEKYLIVRRTIAMISSSLRST